MGKKRFVKVWIVIFLLVLSVGSVKDVTYAKGKGKGKPAPTGLLPTLNLLEDAGKQKKATATPTPGATVVPTLAADDPANKTGSTDGEQSGDINSSTIDAGDPFSQLAGPGYNSEQYQIASVGGAEYGVGNIIFICRVLGVLGCMITLLIVAGKYIAMRNGANRGEIKTAVEQKLMVIVMLGCGLGLFDLVRRIAISLFGL